jgi:prepilin-type N-terminal cleavage/methylation domain-containing protein
MQMKNNRKAGFTLVEIMIVVAIIGLLAAIAIPNFVKARTTSQQNACINNLRLIDSSKQQWALEQRQQSSNTPVGSDLQPYLGRGSAGELPACPVDPLNAFASSYTPGTIGTKPLCIIVSSTHILP